MAKQLKRLFSSTYYKNLELYKPILADPMPPMAMRNPTFVSLFPLVTGGLATAFLPALDMFTAYLPFITKYTCLYASFHSTFQAGIHWGFAASLHDPELHNQDSKYINMQFIYPAAVPLVTWTLNAYIWLLPFSLPRALNSIAAIGLTHVGILVGDHFYVSRGTVPLFFKKYKILVGVVSTVSILLLAFGAYMYPEKTLKKDN